MCGGDRALCDANGITGERDVLTGFQISYKAASGVGGEDPPHTPRQSSPCHSGGPPCGRLTATPCLWSCELQNKAKAFPLAVI